MFPNYTFYSYQLIPKSRKVNPSVAANDSKVITREENLRPNEQKEKKPSKFTKFFNKIVNFGQVKILKDTTGDNMLDRYQLGPELGRGLSAVTYLCTDRQNGEKLACKSISKKKIRELSFEENVRSEVKILRHLPTSSNLVALKGVYEDNRSIHLVMELCRGGELFDHIITKGFLSEMEAVVIAKSILQSIRICQKNGVIHRDLKPENFMFERKDDITSIKIIDFGLSVFFRPGETFYDIVGSTQYMAPEIIKGKYGCEVDIWSAGVIIYVLLCGSPPFIADSDKMIENKILKSQIKFDGHPWPHISGMAKDLIRGMLNPNPKKRWTVDQALGHPWFKMVKKVQQKGN